MRYFQSGIILIGLLAVLISCATNSSPPEAKLCRQSGPVARSETLKVDGAGLYLLIRGRHCDGPVLLWLHGGPGGAERPLFRLYNRALERRYVVAYLDQRGAGRSFDPKANPSHLTVDRHLRDLDRVVDHLRRTLGKEKVVLVGHSWGSALGLIYAHDHPEKVAAFVGVAQFVSGLASQEAQYAFVASEARRRNDGKSLARLAEIGHPPLEAAEVLPLQTLVDRFGGYFHKRPDFLWATFSGVFRGYVAPWEIGKIIRANNISVRAMNDELTALDLRRSVPSVVVPIIFMLGRYDRQLDARLADAYFRKIEAPRKSLVWFEHSAHNIPFEEAELFNRTLVQRLGDIGIK